MPSLLEILNGPLPPHPTDYGAEDYVAKRDARAAAEHARECLGDEIAAARVRARRLLAPEPQWTRDDSDPRFVEWRTEVWREARRALAPALPSIGSGSGLGAGIDLGATTHALERALAFLDLLDGRDLGAVLKDAARDA